MVYPFPTPSRQTPLTSQVQVASVSVHVLAWVDTAWCWYSRKHLIYSLSRCTERSSRPPYPGLRPGKNPGGSLNPPFVHTAPARYGRPHQLPLGRLPDMLCDTGSCVRGGGLFRAGLPPSLTDVLSTASPLIRPRYRRGPASRLHDEGVQKKPLRRGREQVEPMRRRGIATPADVGTKALASGTGDAHVVKCRQENLYLPRRNCTAGVSPAASTITN